MKILVTKLQQIPVFYHITLLFEFFVIHPNFSFIEQDFNFTERKNNI